MSKILVCGAGGFIGGHLAIRLMEEGHELICADIKPKELWFQYFEKNKNFSLDLKDHNNCLKVSEEVDFVFNMACNMGGMGFIENNKAECMLSVLINTNMLRACLHHKIKKYFFSSSACVYNGSKQENNFIEGLKESDAYPAEPEDGYGWEKLFSERMCRHFTEDFGLDTKVARYHNVYGPLGTFDGGREKAPAALCRKIINAKLKNENEIEVWGDGNQTRSFLFIEDAIEGINRIMAGEYKEPLNLGSSRMISINELVSMIAGIAGKEITIKHINGPKGVNGRNSDNTLIKEKLGWSPSQSLIVGTTSLFNWIKSQIELNK
jgi:nucleoside-diphosphate-sugar epimerase